MTTAVQRVRDNTDSDPGRVVKKVTRHQILNIPEGKPNRTVQWPRHAIKKDKLSRTIST